MGHYVIEVEQRTTEFCSVEILIMMLPVLPYLSQLRLTTYADSAEYLTSWFQDFTYILIEKKLQHHILNVETIIALQCFTCRTLCRLTKKIGERSGDGLHQRTGAVRKVIHASVH